MSLGVGAAAPWFAARGWRYAFLPFFFDEAGEAIRQADASQAVFTRPDAPQEV